MKGDFTFSRIERVRKKKEFVAVYTGGKKKVGSFFVLYRRGNGLSHHRLGISVSKKIGNAVVRNRIKRIFRDTFRRMKPSGRAGVDFVFVARSRMRGISPKILAAEYWRFMKAEGLAEDLAGEAK